jgi:hypothetical protein
VSKWQNNVEFYQKLTDQIPAVHNLSIKNTSQDFLKRKEEFEEKSKTIYGKLIQAKRKFNPFKRAIMMSGGFPDFIAFKRNIINGSKEFQYYADGGAEVFVEPALDLRIKLYEVIGIEAKSNGYLTKEEKDKCKWLIKKNIFSKILIAKKGKGGIEYTEFK